MIEAANGAERRDFYLRLDPLNLAPLWEQLHTLVTPQPTPKAVPAHWCYDDVLRPHLLEAGSIISAAEAERRVLVLENPALKGSASITNTLYAGVQLVLPGEVARSHRHTQSAFRFVLEGGGAHTTVEGEMIRMQPGDLILTPNGCWHDHGNESDVPIVWLDGLDIPLVSLLDASFSQPGNSETQMVTRPHGDGLVRFGSGLRPLGWKPDGKRPMAAFPYERTRAALEAAQRSGEDPDPAQGFAFQYVDPTTGGDVLDTMGASIRLLPRDFTGLRHRSTGGEVFVVVEGEGETTIGDTVFRWKPRDVFVAPSWSWRSHRTSAEAVLFSFSDRPVLAKLGLWRDEVAGV